MSFCILGEYTEMKILKSCHICIFRRKVLKTGTLENIRNGTHGHNEKKKRNFYLAPLSCKLCLNQLIVLNVKKYYRDAVSHIFTFYSE